jgi:hypothetical protein
LDGKLRQGAAEGAQPGPQVPGLPRLGIQARASFIPGQPIHPLAAVAGELFPVEKPQIGHAQRASGQGFGLEGGGLVMRPPGIQEGSTDLTAAIVQAHLPFEGRGEPGAPPGPGHHAPNSSGQLMIRLSRMAMTGKR